MSVPSQRSFGRFHPPLCNQMKSSTGAPFRSQNSQFSSFRQNPFSQSSDTKLTQNDDTLSVFSDSTIMGPPSISQDHFNSFRSDICDMFKMIIDNNQKMTLQMIEAFVQNNQKETEKSREEYKEIKGEMIDKIDNILSEATNKNEIKHLKDELQCMTEEMKNQQINFQNEIKKISLGLSNIQRKKPRKHKKRTPEAPRKWWRETEKIPPLPCPCLLYTETRMTRRQKIKAYNEGTLICKCKK
ncbi:unnamed protein product [Blepharisma stoltei]|uniref:Uncharacterized protein n=1 Tax=Blepharisma stoltei TaxID=1481888 RepID=A0AAU9J252_9CILI|nr:unnamed protein product [Blepharisma stoltei]